MCEGIEMKKCRKCGRELPLTEEYFNKRKGSRDGFRNECKECKRKYTAQYYSENKEAFIERVNINRSNHVEEFKKYRHEHYINNRERIINAQKDYYRKNKEKIYARNKRYVENNRAKCRVFGQRYRTRKKELPATLTEKQWEYIKQCFDFKCAYCGATSLLLEQDHFIPLSKGGEYTHNNIIPACRSCNSSKSAQLFWEWYPKQSFYNKKREKRILKFLGYSGEIQQLALM